MCAHTALELSKQKTTKTDCLTKLTELNGMSLACMKLTEREREGLPENRRILDV